ncbi:MAG: galactokinase, partial [Clostridia bacterium]|nr:galactokinase [Clostridia bacterium]
VSAVEIAQIAQFAENEYFGKPCGLMDQMACSVGGFVAIDFNDPAVPVINKVDFDFASCNHALCIVDTGGNHADLTDEYAAVRGEMEAVAAKFGKSVLHDVDRAEFEKNISVIRDSAGDRAVLRAMHFFNENERVAKQADALKSGDFEAFKALIIESGFSSYMYNQNVYTCKMPAVQPVSVALAICQNILGGKGAWRVHGGGFAGTIQAFVPMDLLCEFKAEICAVFGEKSCYVLNIRPEGGVKVI